MHATSFCVTVASHQQEGMIEKVLISKKNVQQVKSLLLRVPALLIYTLLGLSVCFFENRKKKWGRGANGGQHPSQEISKGIV